MPRFCQPGRGRLLTAVAQVLEGRPLPTIYLRAAAAEDGAPRFVSGHALMCRENGFMIALPDVDLVHATLGELLTPDGVPLSLSLQVELPCETVRGRRLGPGALLLVDLLWESLSLLCGRTPFDLLEGERSDLRCFKLPTHGSTIWTPRRLKSTILQPSHFRRETSSKRSLRQQFRGRLATMGGEGAATPPPNSAREADSRAFQSGPTHRAEDWEFLRRLAGTAPPRTGRVQQAQRPAPTAALHLESEFEALPPAEVADPDLELQYGSSMEMLLLASLRQNAAFRMHWEVGQRVRFQLRNQGALSQRSISETGRGPSQGRESCGGARSGRTGVKLG